MSEIVMIYGDGKTYYYKPMGVKTITKKVKDELKKNADGNYNVCQSGVLTVKDGEKPNKKGYYSKDQVEHYDRDEEGEFIKMRKLTKSYYDCKHNMEIEV